MFQYFPEQNAKTLKFLKALLAAHKDTFKRGVIHAAVCMYTQHSDKQMGLDILLDVYAGVAHITRLEVIDMYMYTELPPTELLTVAEIETWINKLELVYKQACMKV
jgi:hypothetical protein